MTKILPPKQISSENKAIGIGLVVVGCFLICFNSLFRGLPENIYAFGSGYCVPFYVIIIGYNFFVGNQKLQLLKLW